MNLLKRKLHFIVPVVLVVAAGVATQTFRSSADNADLPTTGIGQDYYVQPVIVETAPLNKSGDAWDSIDQTAPDVYVEIFWQGQRVFQSSTKNDSLIARWSNAEVDVRDLVISGKRASVDDVIPAARVRVQSDDSLLIKVYDRDLLSRDDLIGSIEIPTTELKEGEYDYSGENALLKRLLIKVFPLESIPDLTSVQEE